MKHEDVIEKYGDVVLEVTAYQDGGFILEREQISGGDSIKICVCFTPNDIYKAEVTDKSTMLGLIRQDASVWVTITNHGIICFDDEVYAEHIPNPHKPLPNLRLASSN